MDDWQLLDEFVTRNSQTAFQTLVSRHLAMVRSSAFRQVRDLPLAEEVAQAVFILLARKAAKLCATKNLVLGGWLHRTTCFVGARTLRGELRRRSREHQAFQMQQLHTAEDTWRRIAPLLDEGIEHLDRPARDAVILRYFQDQSFLHVGQALGIGEEAARKRVDRSLEKLRAFFARRGFTVSSAALATTLAGHKSEAAPAELAAAIGGKALLLSRVAGTALPALVMETIRAWHWAVAKRFAWAGAAAAVVALLVTGAWNSWIRPPAKAAPTDAVSNQLPLAAAPALNDNPSATQATASEPRLLALRAVDAATGKGIPFAVVSVLTLRDMEAVTARPQRIDLQTNLHTDRDGQLDIHPPYADPLMMVVGVQADGQEERCVVASDQKPLPMNYVLRLPPGSTIGGVVVDETQKPVADASVQVLFYGTGDSSEREFQRERPGFAGDDLPSAKTDRAGRWFFRSAPTNGAFYITVTHPDFPVATFRNDEDEHGSPDGRSLKLADLHEGKALLALHGGLSLHGFVTDESGNAVAGAKISHGMFFPEGHGVSADLDGSFVLRPLPEGENYITIRAEHYAPQRIRVQMTRDTAPLAVKLKPGALLQVRVVDSSASPVSGAFVGLEQWQGPNTLEWKGLTDGDGQVIWDSAPVEPITLSVLKKGYFNSRNIRLTADGQVHTIALHPQVVVSGSVTEADSKLPVASFKVIPSSDRSETAYGTNGQYTLALSEWNPPWVLRVEAVGYEPVVSEPLELAVTNMTLDFKLMKQSPANAIEGIVLLPDGSSAPGAQVALCAGRRPIELGRARLLPSEEDRLVETDADGHFSFASEPSARGVLAVRSEGIGAVLLKGPRTGLSVQLQPWGRIAGTLRVKNGSNAGREICLMAPSAGGSEDLFAVTGHRVTTDAGGNFTFEQAPPGSFNLWLNGGVGHSFLLQTPVQIHPGETLRVQVGGTGVTVSGRLQLTNQSRSIDWSKQLIISMLQSKLAYPPGMDPRAQAEWFQAYSKTEEGQAALRAVGTYALELQPDGSFIAEAVRPGAYELSGQLSDTEVDLSRGVVGRTIASFRQDVTVPNSPGEEFDLGTVVVGEQNP